MGKSGGDGEKLREDIWPIERDLMFRPERMKYVRKLVKPDGCVFCQAVVGEPSEESLLLYKGAHSMVMINKYPYNNGHLLVLPQRHCGEYLELSTEEFTDLHKTLRAAVAAVSEAYECPGFNIGMNHGQVAGAGIPEHLHYHLIPRWSGDANFFPLVAQTKVVIESLDQTYKLLRPYFDQL